MSASGHYVSEPSLHHARPHREVDDGLFLTVIDSGEHSLIRLLLHNLHLLDHLCRDVLRSKLRVIQEEGLAVDGDLLDGLSIGCNGSIRLHLDSRKLLEEFLEHIVVGSLERRCIILDGILLHDDRITDSRHLGCIKYLYILFHLHSTQVLILIKRHILHMCLITHDLSLEHIGTLSDLGQLRLSFRVGKDIF